MASIRRLTYLVLLILAAGLLSSCVPIPPYDPVLAQRGVSVQQGIAATPAPSATAVANSAQAEPTSTPASLAQVEPTSAPATLVPVEPTSTPVALAPTATLIPTETIPPTPTISFTDTPAPTNTSLPTSTPRPTSTLVAMSVQAAASTPAPTPTATVDQHLIIITEDDIAKAVAGGAGAQQGVTLDNLKVRFAGGKTHITADKLGYSFINLQNLDLVGSLAAQNGVLSLAVESISPRGLAANFVPGAVNQALANYASQWYVEEVRTLDGRVELRIR
jgi:hypothetical protein